MLLVNDFWEPETWYVSYFAPVFFFWHWRRQFPTAIEEDNSLQPLDRIVFNFTEKSEAVLQIPKVS